MSMPVVGMIVAVVVVLAIYFLFVVPGERRYHETKLRLMQERIERRQREQQDSESTQDGGAPPDGT